MTARRVTKNEYLFSSSSGKQQVDHVNKYVRSLERTAHVAMLLEESIVPLALCSQYDYSKPRD
jgi:hypothetical protein